MPSLSVPPAIYFNTDDTETQSSEFALQNLPCKAVKNLFIETDKNEYFEYFFVVCLLGGAVSELLQQRINIS